MADKNGIRILKHYSQKLKSFFLSKDILSFLLFLVLSAGFWFVNALGKEKEKTLSIPVRYVGIPVNIAITNSPPQEIRINIKDQGLRLFDYTINHTTPLTIDLNRTFKQKGEILITADQLSGKISRYLHLLPSSTVLEVKPDSIFIQYQKLSVKKLPVEFVNNISLTNQYMLSEKIKLEPAWIHVFGPKQVLDTLKSVRTELVEYTNLKDTVFSSCNLQPIKLVRFSSNRIKYSIFVEPFTERKVQLMIISSNCPPNLSIRTFPAFITCTYTVGLSRFNKFKPTDIQVYLDYNELKFNKLSKQRLNIKNNTSHISNIRISPQEVEFILEKN